MRWIPIFYQKKNDFNGKLFSLFLKNEKYLLINTKYFVYWDLWIDIGQKIVRLNECSTSATQNPQITPCSNECSTSATHNPLVTPCSVATWSPPNHNALYRYTQ